MSRYSEQVILRILKEINRGVTISALNEIIKEHSDLTMREAKAALRELLRRRIIEREENRKIVTYHVRERPK